MGLGFQNRPGASCGFLPNLTKLTFCSNARLWGPYLCLHCALSESLTEGRSRVRALLGGRPKTPPVNVRVLLFSTAR